MDDAESLTEADDTFDDDCTCPPECRHESHLTRPVGHVECDPTCPVHGGELAPGRGFNSDKFTWYPGDVVIIEPGDPEYEDDDDDV